MFVFTLMDIIYLRNLIGLSLHLQRVSGWSDTESGINKRKYLLFMAECHQICTRGAEGCKSNFIIVEIIGLHLCLRISSSFRCR